MTRIDGYILTGGMGSRMGVEKGPLMIGGQSLVARIASELSPAAGEIFTVGGDTRFDGLAHIEDSAAAIAGHERYPRSALVGLLSALMHARTESIFAVACDMPFVSTALFELILSKSRDPYGAVAPCSSDDIIQPLCAVYNVRACLDVFSTALENNQRSLKRLLDLVNVRRVPFDEIRRLSGSDRFFNNLNTPEDYEHALAAFQSYDT